MPLPRCSANWAKMLWSIFAPILETSTDNSTFWKKMAEAYGCRAPHRKFALGLAVRLLAMVIMLPCVSCCYHQPARVSLNIQSSTSSSAGGVSVIRLHSTCSVRRRYLTQFLQRVTRPVCVSCGTRPRPRIRPARNAADRSLARQSFPLADSFRASSRASSKLCLHNITPYGVI